MKITFVTNTANIAYMERKLAAPARHGEYLVRHTPSKKHPELERYTLTNKFSGIGSEMQQTLGLMEYRKEIAALKISEEQVWQ